MMKKAVPLFLSVVFFAVPFVSAHADISTGLVGWWKMDEGAGSNVIDYSGSANTGTSVSTPSYVAGEIGPYALSFNGTSQYFDVPAMTVNYSAITVSAWIKPSNVGAGDNPRIVANDHTDSDNKGFQLMYNNGGATGFFDVGNGSAEGRATWSQQLVNGKWYLYTGVYDGSHVYAYINGVQVASSTLTGSIAASGVDVNIGRNQAYAGDYFPGTVDDVHMYNRALSATDVLQLYNYANLSANEMTSPSYTITINSINFGGDYSTSTSYQEQDTAGEMATGNSSSTNYFLSAGYQQMYTSYISIGTLSPLNLGHISGLGSATATGTLAINIVTDNPAGYSLSVQASSSPAMQTAAGSYFSDYTPVSSPTPDYAFAIASNTSAFGFSVNSADAVEKYINNGSACNIGSNNTAFACWDSFSTSPKIIAQSSLPNSATGTVTTLDVEAKEGSAKLQDAGTYTATITVTAITL